MISIQWFSQMNSSAMHSWPSAVAREFCRRCSGRRDKLVRHRRKCSVRDSRRRQAKLMCNRARNWDTSVPEALRARYGADWLAGRPMDNRFNPTELMPRGRAYLVRENERGRGIDIMSWDVLGGGSAFAPIDDAEIEWQSE